MTIESIKDETSFITKLNETLSPSLPIRTIELLRGRSMELEVIRRALIMPGRHVFVYGDRGVGKSSLAHTAATQYQSSDAAPITVPGSADDTFQSIVANIACRALDRSRVNKKKTTKSASIAWRGLNLGFNSELTPLDLIDQVRTIGDATALLTEVAKLHSDEPIVIVDEFDAIENVQERNKFASLLKQMGDQGVGIKFIFTGVGSSLDDLLGAHQSAYRQLETVELARLGWEGRREIALQAAHAFGLDLDDNIAWSIAIVSDGFPYFIHLIMEKMLWEAFAADKQVDRLGETYYLAGIRAAIGSITAELRRPYEKAVLHRSAEYEAIVWATADSEDLRRDIPSMYESYKVVCRKREEDTQVSRAKFGDRLRQLKGPGYGNVLEGVESRPGWYIYREKMLRGYVRMQAAAGGVQLSGEREAPKQKMHVSTGARNGYFGSSVPPGIKLRAERQGNDTTNK